MKIRFQADADLNENIIAGLQRREPGIDFRTAAEAGLRGLSDFEVLEVAARDGRMLVSHDFRTMPTAFARFLEESRRQAMQQRTEKSGGVGRVGGGSPGL